MKNRIRITDELVEYKGEHKLMRVLCRELGVPRSSVGSKMKKGMSIEEAVEEVRLNQWRRKVRRMMKSA